MPNYCNESYSDLVTYYIKKVISAWTEVWCGSYPARAPITARDGHSEQIFEFVEILVEDGDIYNSTSMPTYCDEPYSNLGIYINKVYSAWA